MNQVDENFLKKCLIGVFLLLASILFIRKRKTTFPPGPVAFPLIGNVLQLGKRPHLTLTKWAKKYGPIFRINVAMHDTLIITEPKLVKQLFSENAASGRWSGNPVITEFTKGPNGVINAEGATWETQRRFALRTLRDFGFSKSTMQDLILDEVQAMIKWFESRQGNPISGNRIFNAPVANSLWHLVSGERCDWENSKPPILLAMDEFMEAVQAITSNGLMFAPFMRHVAPGLLSWNAYSNSVDKMMRLFDQCVSKHSKELNLSNPKDFVDHHLIQIENTVDPNSSFYKDVGYKNLLAGMFDLFFAGSETVSHTLSWILLYLSHHQDIQKQLISEIDEVVGTSRLPTLSDKQKMPFTEAVIFETLRMSTVLSLGVMHRILSQMSFHNYTLEPNTIVFANIYGIHHDESIWGDPNTFRPQRFLSEDGQKIIWHDAFIPFSEGKRKCMGEGLARDSLFLFTSGIFQNFHVLPDPDSKHSPDFEADLGYFQVPKPFRIVMSGRKAKG